MRISYWSSDVCSSDLPLEDPGHGLHVVGQHLGMALEDLLEEVRLAVEVRDQVLDTGAGVELMDLPHGLGIEPRSTVGKVVASDAGDGGIFALHLLDALGHPSRLVAVQRRRLHGVDLADVKATGAHLAPSPDSCHQPKK